MDGLVSKSGGSNRRPSLYVKREKVRTTVTVQKHDGPREFGKPTVWGFNVELPEGVEQQCNY